MAKGISVAKGETVGSLRTYFFLVAIVSGAFNVLALVGQPLGFGTAFALVGIVVCGGYLYAAIRLKTLIVAAPRQIEWVLFASGALAIANLIVSAVFQSMIGIGQSAIVLLIVWYLVANVRRLAGEASRVAHDEPTDTAAVARVE